MKRLVWPLACAVLVGCTASGGGTYSPSPSPSVSASPSASSSPSESPSPSPSPSPSMTLELSAEQQAALETVQEYHRLVNEARNDPEMDLLPLAVLFANPKIANDTYRWLHADRENGVRQVGEVIYHYEEVGEPVEAAGVRSISVTLCADTSNSDLVDANGVSVLSADRTGYARMDFDVIERNGAWLLNDFHATVEAKC